MLAIGGLGLGAVPATADAADDLAAARAAADDLAERWFAAQQQAADLDAEVAALEQDLADLQSRTRAARGTARAQAVALYQGASGGAVTSFFGGTDIMDAARRNVLLADASAVSRAELDRYSVLVRDTRDRIAELDAARAEQRRALAELADDEAALERELARAQQAYRAEQAALAAAEAAASRAEASSQPDANPDDPGDGGTTATTDAPSDPDPTPEPDPVDPPPPPEPGEHPHHNDPFLACVRQRESRGDYTVVNWDGPWYGAYQFAAGTWNATASHAGRPELIGVLPSAASPWDQDDLAWDLYQWQGKGPWGGGCG